jgi:integrase
MPKPRPMTAKNVDKWLRAGAKFVHLDRGSKDSVRGLMLQVTGKRAASWVLRYQRLGTVRHMGLGSAFEFSLSEARTRARRYRQQLSDGIDPLALRQSEQASVQEREAKRLTFAEAARRWHEAKDPGWTRKHSTSVWGRLDRWAFPIIGRKDVGGIDTQDVLAVLQQPVTGSNLWLTHTQTADRLRKSVRQVLDWTAVAGHRGKELPNPARWEGHLQTLLAAPSKIAPTRNMRALDYRKVPAMWAALTGHEAVGAEALRFALLTCARINEAAQARHEEIDLDPEIGPTWRVPAGRMKARRPHRQPLSSQAIELIARLPTESNNPFLFIGSQPGRPITDSAIRQVLRRLKGGYAEETVVHGLRSSFRDWCAERTAFSREAAEAALSHQIGDDEVERAYLRSDLFEKRRQLLQLWADFVTSPPVAAKSSVVVPIGRRQ